MSVLSMCASCLAIMLSSILNSPSQCLSGNQLHDLPDILHRAAPPSVLAVPAVPVVEHEVRGREPVEALVYPVEVHHRGGRTALLVRVELLDLHDPVRHCRGTGAPAGRHHWRHFSSAGTSPRRGPRAAHRLARSCSSGLRAPAVPLAVLCCLLHAAGDRTRRSLRGGDTLRTRAGGRRSPLRRPASG